MRTFASKLGGFFPRVGADVVQLAAKSRHDLLARPDVQKLRATRWRDRLITPDQDPGIVYDQLKEFLDALPDEGFKLFPWVVREFKKGNPPDGRAHDHFGRPDQGITYLNKTHAFDIVQQAIRWLVWCREHNRPAPDMMSKQFALPQLEAWVYEMNAENTSEEWLDSKAVYSFPDHWYIAQVGPQDVGKEGEIMGHCVGGYVEEARDGRIYSLRDPQDRPHVTVELSDNPEESKRIDILQQQGKSNDVPKPEYQDKLDEWYQHLNQNGWNVENREDREPEDVYEDHPSGDFVLDAPEDVLRYRDAITDRWDKNEFRYDEEPEYNANDHTYTYWNPRELAIGDGGFPALAAQYAQQVVAGQHEEGDIDHFVQGLWIGLRHYLDRQYEGNRWQSEWQDCINAATNAAENFGPRPKRIKQPTLFEPNQYIDKPPIPVDLRAMIRYMEQLKNAPDQWEVPITQSVRNPNWTHNNGEPFYLLDENGNTVTEPSTRTDRLWFPPESDFPEDYFHHIGMPGISMAGTFARYIKTTNLVEKLVKLAAYPEAPACPYDGHELDIHFHGGVECPRCGSEFELGQDDRLLPSLNTLGQDAAEWPDKLPEHWAGWTTPCPQCNEPLGSNEWQCNFCRQMHDNPGNDGWDMGKATPEWLQMPREKPPEGAAMNDWRFSADQPF